MKVLVRDCKGYVAQTNTFALRTRLVVDRGRVVYVDTQYCGRTLCWNVACGNCSTSGSFELQHLFPDLQTLEQITELLKCTTVPYGVRLTEKGLKSINIEQDFKRSKIWT
jgi:hypothetical protein